MRSAEVFCLLGMALRKKKNFPEKTEVATAFRSISNMAAQRCYHLGPAQVVTLVKTVYTRGGQKESIYSDIY